MDPVLELDQRLQCLEARTTAMLTISKMLAAQAGRQEAELKACRQAFDQAVKEAREAQQLDHPR